MAHSRFDDHYRLKAKPRLFQHLGEVKASDAPKNVVYIAEDGTETLLTGIITHPEHVDEYEGGERMLSEKREVVISRDPDDVQFGGIEHPSIRAKVKVDGVEYAIEDMEAKSPTLSRLRLTRRPTMERARTGYRRIRQ